MKGCPALTSEQLTTALSSLTGRHVLRNRALVLLGVRSGLRISELLSLKVGQLWDGKSTVSRFYVTRRSTKGKMAGTSIILHPEAAEAVKKWIESQGPPPDREEFLFRSQKRRNEPLDRRSAWRLLHSIFRRAGVAGMAGTHCLRKTFARNVHEALGRDLFRTSKAMRHASPMTTLSYLSFRQDEIDQAILESR